MAGAGIHPYHQQWVPPPQPQPPPPAAPPIHVENPNRSATDEVRPPFSCPSHSWRHLSVSYKSPTISWFSFLSKVRTVFISGLPGDVKERELHNLLRWLPGFEASQINFKGEQPMGFALFSSPQHAMAAKNALQVIAPIFLSSLLLIWLGYLDLGSVRKS